MSSGWWFIVQWVLAAIGAMVFWCLVLVWGLSAIDRWWHHHHPGPHTPR